MVDKEYYTSKEIRERFNWSRQSLYATAKREGWRLKDYRRPYEFNARDVEDYTMSRLHSTQARLQGHHFRGIIRHRHNWSDFCPICNKNDDSAFNKSDNSTGIDSSAGNNSEIP